MQRDQPFRSLDSGARLACQGLHFVYLWRILGHRGQPHGVSARPWAELVLCMSAGARPNDQ
jgi:hypothetical protein